MKKLVTLACILAVTLAITANAFAEPSGGWVHIVTVRPYSGSDMKAFITVDTTALCGTSVFAINTSGYNGKEMYASALAAMLAGKQVMLEVRDDSQCAGYGTLLQSIYINSN